MMRLPPRGSPAAVALVSLTFRGQLDLTARQAVCAAVAALACAGLLLAWQAPVIGEELRSVQDALHQTRTQLDQARARLAALRQAIPEQGLVPTALAPELARVSSGLWHWHSLALAAGLELEQLRPAQTLASSEQTQLQLRVRGRYDQHGAFVAALSGPAHVARLTRYQLESGPAGMHSAELALQWSAVSPGAMIAASSAPRSYRAGPHADPLSESRSAESLEAVPAFVRAEHARIKSVLEASPLSAFALAGTLQRGGEWLALLQAERMLHTLRVGDHVGSDFGRVMRIAEQGVWLREIVRDSQGRWTEQERLWRVGQMP